MDDDDIENSLQEEFNEYCVNNDIEATDSQYELFIEIATERINEILTGVDDIDQAYDIYLEEINGDLSFVLDPVED